MSSTQEARSAAYPPLSAQILEQFADLTETIARERLSESAWTDTDSNELREATLRLMAATRTLHAFSLSNADEPSFILRLT